MKLSFLKARNIIIGIILVVSASGIGYFFGVKGFEANFRKFPKVTVSRETPPAKSLDFSLFWKVWDTISLVYYDKSKIVPSKMVYGAIKGMVASLGDPYTAFLPPEENKVTQEDLNGNFEGVGVQIGFKGTQLAVIAPLSGSPAEKAGIKAGDYIIGLKDQRKNIQTGTVGMSLPQAVEIIRGQAGTRITLTLLRKETEAPITIEVTREVINVPSVVLTFKGENNSLAVITLSKFSADTKQQWAKVIESVLVKGESVKGIILDMRNNPGGYLDGAIDIASEFIKSGTVLIEEDGKGVRNEVKVSRVGRVLDYPLTALVNSGSASASEIVAGALKDNKRASIVGETTFGKGTVQEPQQIEGGSSLHITTSKWLTPSGFWVNDKGLTPDVKILDDEKTDKDEQLEKAIELLK
ncbi:hypothetical protein A3D00_03310 [Candidatus Woesebacteria bacterium RIFCSPHIGHO2_02_FULL_38_9]|uniref:PDZ domain-containing protein n=1 Tax=Candidatus Woesebacteria bacterium RIFCSPHIGHO2_01_FULL_39_28 TaxID=1802496 RepID=A0A1F7YEH4_9BACT|nr:MAG: hypothetical protein A2627_01515 [Candidatus Woesebacteria bacterium RIFCSPHIGHO2_01_FULL_39_28]OGM32263.1 MAG: hypothetical protein A3D00_03310 [Candidatus Woesebacteria bacterium RIFCSPHIGHO2_02_FULL_38_9]OGM56864.1 MAG: hypothetical protein A3A50_03900 [Candidatus Woesebacteria bacterium RIFCSPLOWO2_01_FULL_38_20]